MLPSLDIFKIDPGHGVLWRGAVKSFVAANARIRMLALASPGEYLILDEDTGQRILVNGLRGIPSNPPLVVDARLDNKPPFGSYLYRLRGVGGF